MQKHMGTSLRSTKKVETYCSVDSTCNNTKIYGLKSLGSRHNLKNNSLNRRFQKRTIRKCQNCFLGRKSRLPTKSRPIKGKLCAKNKIFSSTAFEHAILYNKGFIVKLMVHGEVNFSD